MKTSDSKIEWIASRPDLRVSKLKSGIVATLKVGDIGTYGAFKAVYLTVRGAGETKETYIANFRVTISRDNDGLDKSVDKQMWNHKHVIATPDWTAIQNRASKILNAEFYNQ